LQNLKIEIGLVWNIFLIKKVVKTIFWKILQKVLFPCEKFNTKNQSSNLFFFIFQNLENFGMLRFWCFALSIGRVIKELRHKIKKIEK
jgi:hypothetical protein